MESTDLEEIKAALWEQASHPCTRTSKLRSSASDGNQTQEGTTPGSASWAGALVSGGSCDHFSTRTLSNWGMRYRRCNGMKRSIQDEEASAFLCHIRVLSA